MITIIDYGMGNIGSLENMFRRAGSETSIASLPEEAEGAEKLVLPGVGSFAHAMERLKSLGFVDALNRKVRTQAVPILCICLGAQLITEGSEEGGAEGLGWIHGRTVRFRFPEGSPLKVPHMGWNDVVTRKPSPLFAHMDGEPYFYFVHSYHLVCDDRADVLSTTTYGYEFVSSLERGNIYATQFHPEKSHKYGLQLIKNFAEI